MVQLTPAQVTNAWVPASWEEFVRLTDDPAYAKAKGYYFNQQMRIESVGVGPDHARENTLLILVIGLYCGLNGIPIVGLTHCSYRKAGVREAQPDISYYVGSRAALAPQGRAIANLDEVPPPDLAIEIADSLLADDLGTKRLLYEELEVAEYWVVDVSQSQIIAFQIANQGSRRIPVSQVLPGLELSVLQAALEQSKQVENSQVVAQLMAQFQRSREA
ncbi:Uma2 family endonuclease [Thermoleptolyngbya sichuanensis XZ-Cy5]|uniref:Uma2 family endonuclease n=1 Tax=Thermoleptolyngbya sichuanensis TaxID=2885951 RepID=UPI00240E5576|nr:Uma2 family endonuclease [Thermoleptolyngbya sichuanensis]MDG2616855.1 Uma2 family endonuclease [Thermoleptolyngbya sichuanensis XZ-Cy5]